MSYQPQTREVIVHCLSHDTWVSGRVVLPVNRSLLDHVNAELAFLKLRDAVFAEGPRRTAAFFTLRREGIGLILPEAGESGLLREDGIGRFSDRWVACVFAQGEVEGRVSIRENVRVSDELIRTKDFFAVRDATLRLPSSSTALPLPSPAPLILVNATQVVGVADLDAS